ncbi:hypothetical protein H1C71_010265 [Ictidomys tridecemlineatus]|nr:hypothetical protein H1C71_010265 [Ictidomys tridecemlineatus]KAG3286674.1 hypothetical protein H1C71_010265 [Ictidomys tridecemlineatus]KAG3286675.1 hypothetical protein H1C71_010265 [Ictidomys tridecemlineatus]
MSDSWKSNSTSRLFPRHHHSTCFQLSIGLLPVSGSFPCEAIRSGKAGLASLSGPPRAWTGCSELLVSQVPPFFSKPNPIDMHIDPWVIFTKLPWIMDKALGQT